jgi:type II secretory pathway pseudopilin PulG
MSIIILLISLLVPALNRVRRYATRVKQSAQFHSIAVALDLFNAEYDGYPDSNAFDDLGVPYCGAMKLCEAMVGQDLKGFNPTSRFERKGFNWAAPYLGMPYPPLNTCGGAVDIQCYTENLKSRKMHLQLENANAYQLGDIYDRAIVIDSSYGGNAAVYDPCTFVLCDVYNRVTNRSTGKKIGMPILYYRADLTKTMCPDPTVPFGTIKNSLSSYIYDVRDNQGLIEKGMPWDTTGAQPLSFNDPTWPIPFYRMIRDPLVPTKDRPYRTDSYILLSAGFDGQYGTSDDIFNFNKVGE